LKLLFSGGGIAADEKALKVRIDSFIIMGELLVEGSLQLVDGVLSRAHETTKTHSVAEKIDENSSVMTKRPFRLPHHTISDE
jgi:predicted ATPase with chaperone activity